MRRISLTIIGACIALCAAGARAQTPDLARQEPAARPQESSSDPTRDPSDPAPTGGPAFKLTPRIAQALLFETNPASEHAPRRGYWSWATIAGLDLNWRIAPGAALSLSLQEKIWRYPRRIAWHSNDSSAVAALTFESAGFSYGARVSGFMSHDARFGALIERRVDVGLFVSRAFVEPTTGARLTPSLSIARRFADDPASDKWRVGLGLAVSRRVGAIEFTARLGLAHETFRRCAARPCRIDRGATASLGATWTPRPGVEIGASLDVERYLSTRRDQSYAAITASPRIGAKMDF
ncbi:MAG: hypothetical protein IPL88_07050 [Rhizobiales bacterium]|nr:hypothetical protein [Hyphomicrobiales bacterium]